ncbi:MAG: hypothetical protein V1679_01800 [Candidatus Peregrinibacteria bacterium]
MTDFELSSDGRMVREGEESPLGNDEIAALATAVMVLHRATKGERDYAHVIKTVDFVDAVEKGSQGDVGGELAPLNSSTNRSRNYSERYVRVEKQHLSGLIKGLVKILKGAHYQGAEEGEKFSSFINRCAPGLLASVNCHELMAEVHEEVNAVLSSLPNKETFGSFTAEEKYALSLIWETLGDSGTSYYCTDAGKSFEIPYSQEKLPLFPREELDSFTTPPEREQGKKKSTVFPRVVVGRERGMGDGRLVVDSGADAYLQEAAKNKTLFFASLGDVTGTSIQVPNITKSDSGTDFRVSNPGSVIDVARAGKLKFSVLLKGFKLLVLLCNRIPEGERANDSMKNSRSFIHYFAGKLRDAMKNKTPFIVERAYYPEFRQLLALMADISDDNKAVYNQSEKSLKGLKGNLGDFVFSRGCDKSVTLFPSDIYKNSEEIRAGVEKVISLEPEIVDVITSDKSKYIKNSHTSTENGGEIKAYFERGKKLLKHLFIKVADEGMDKFIDDKLALDTVVKIGRFNDKAFLVLREAIYKRLCEIYGTKSGAEASVVSKKVGNVGAGKDTFDLDYDFPGELKTRVLTDIIGITNAYCVFYATDASEREKAFKETGEVVERIKTGTPDLYDESLEDQLTLCTFYGLGLPNDPQKKSVILERLVFVREVFSALVKDPDQKQWENVGPEFVFFLLSESGGEYIERGDIPIPPWMPSEMLETYRSLTDVRKKLCSSYYDSKKKKTATAFGNCLRGIKRAY